MTDGALGPDTQRVLITGAQGFIGTALMKAQAHAKHCYFIGADREDANLCDMNSVRDLLERTRPERIVHLAGTLVKGDSPDVLQQQWENTFIAGTHVIEAAAKLGVRHVVVAGTIDELGNQAGILGPDLRTEPRSEYGLCKCLLRDYAAFWVRKSPMRVDWFRPFVVYGPGQTRGKMLLPTAFRAAALGQKAAFSDGLQKRDFIHVDDIVDWILLALQLRVEGDVGVLKVHHLGTGEAVEVRTVLSAIARAFPEAQFDIGGIPRRPGEPPVEVAAPYTCEDEPLRHWKAKYRWAEGIAQTCEWWRQHARETL